jgi:hypothetical protein
MNARDGLIIINIGLQRGVTEGLFARWSSWYHHYAHGIARF